MLQMWKLKTCCILTMMSLSATKFCGFEKGFCTWYNIQDAELTDDFDWIIASGLNSSSFTGPTADYIGNVAGKFILIKSSFPNKPNQNARLASQLFNQSSSNVGQCFLFSYYMNGTSPGKLKIYKDSSTSEKLVWMQSGNKGDRWLRGQVNVGISTTAYRVIIEGVVGDGSQGDIAVDNVFFDTRNCTVIPADAGPAANQTTANVTKRISGFCNFERGFCTWYNIKDAELKDDFDWIIASGLNSSSFTGPTADYIGNVAGKFILIKSSFPNKPNQNARLASQLFNHSSSNVSQCFLFRYHMYGTSVGKLNIYVNSSNSEKLVWMQSGNKGNDWLKGRVNVGIATTAYRIIVEEVVGDGSQGGIAVDNIFIESLYNCATYPVDADPAVSQSVTVIPTTTRVTKPTSDVAACSDPKLNNCVQNCYETYGSYYCGCKKEFYLNSDQKSCQVLSSYYSELKLQIIMNSPNFNSELLHIMISGYLNDSKMLLDYPNISISNIRAGVVNVTVRYAKMSDDNHLKFYQYMENIYCPALCKNASIKKVLLLCNDCCMTESTEEDTYKEKYTFNTTLVNSTSFVLCKYNAALNKFATRFCSWNSLNGAYWEDANFSDCNPKLNATIELISLSEIPTCFGAETNISCLSPEVKIQKLNKIKTSKSIFSTHEDIVLVSNILEDVFMKSSAKLNVTADIFDMVNMILSTDSSLVVLAQNTYNSSRKILEVLRVLANESTEEFKEFKLPFKKYSYKYFALTLAPAKYTETFIQVNSQGQQDPSVNIMDAVSTCNQKRIDWDASVLIPRSALSLQDNILFSFVFEKPSFFLLSNNSASLHFNQGEKRQNGTGVIVSSIISASVFNHSVKSLKKPIKLSFKKVDHKNLNGSLDCYFWNTTLESWSNAGCRKVFENSFKVMCECNHLTNFALILDISQRGYNPLALQIVSWIGNVISIGALLISILALLLLRKRCRQLSLKIHLQLCISLVALIVIFLAGAERRSKHLISCRVIAGLLQYFILTTFLWTAVEAVSLYKNFVAVFHTVDPIEFLRIASLLAWGVPLLIVAISAGVARGSFGDCDLCLLRGNAFYFGVLTPVSVILVSNFIVLVLVMVSLSTRRVEKLVVNQEKIGLYRRILRSSRNAFAFSTLLGLSWFFAMFAVGDVMELFQWLFCIFNSLQGLFLFALYILRNGDLQEQVLTLWRLLFLSSRNKSSSSTFNNAFTDSSNDASVRAIKSSNVELKNFSSSKST